MAKKKPAKSLLNTLLISHQDGLLEFKMSRGGYSVQSGTISISIETEADDYQKVPNCALIASDGHPLALPLKKGMEFSCEGGMDAGSVEGVARASAYFMFHAEKIEVKWTVREVRKDSVVFELEAMHDDVNYYDKRAKRTPTHGLFELKQKPRSKLWIPE